MGNRTFDVTQDNRVIINSTTVREVVQSSPSRRAERRDAPRDGSTTGDDYTPFVLAGIAALLVMVGYLRYRDAVTLTVLSVSGFAMFLPIGALVVARVRAVSYARSQLAQVWINVLLVCASLVSIYFLSHPAAGFDSAEFAALLEAGERRASLRELFERFGIDWALFLAYQLMGLAVSVLTVAAIALHSLKLYAVAAAAVRARSDATYQPGPVRAWLIRAGGSPGQVFRRAIVLAVLSIVLISGAGYALVTKLQGDVEFPLPSTPTTPSTVSPPPAVPPADPSPVPGPAT
ncbi:hypothetical protein DQ244_16310 [Blastococcus sp. TBT05-19]|nr:hypothetical protein DQ244_16310 [Blastococcus sp. TBT05-19]